MGAKRASARIHLRSDRFVEGAAQSLVGQGHIPGASEPSVLADGHLKPRSVRSYDGTRRERDRRSPIRGTSATR